MIKASPDSLNAMEPNEMPEYTLKSLGANDAQAYPIGVFPFRIGRLADNDIILTSSHVSRHHAELYMAGETMRIKDLKSRNHTYVNGEQVEDVALSPEDRVRFADEIFVFKRSDALCFRDQELGAEFGEKIKHLKELCLPADLPNTAHHAAVSCAESPPSDQHTVVTIFSELENLRTMHGQLEMLLHISNTLASHLDTDALLRCILSELASILPAEKIAIFLKDGAAFIKRIESGTIDARSAISSTVINKVIEKREYVLVGNATADRELQEADSVKAQHIQSILCVPITFYDELLGMIYLDNSSAEHVFDESHARLLGAVAGQAAIACKNALLWEEVERNHERTVELERLATIGTFALEISHQMKNKLVPFHRLSKLRSLVGENQDAVTLIDSLSHSAEDFEKINKGVQRLACSNKTNPEWFDISLLAQQIYFSWRDKLNEKGIAFVRDIAPATKIYADRIQLEQVLCNLLANAIDAIEKPQGNIILAFLREGDQWVISFKDNGGGIPPEIMSHIFEPFWTTKRTSGGMGLGLTLARAIVLAHGGRVEVKSDVGIGTEFIMYLPVHGTAPDPPGGHSK